jgi:hypothetical protein
MTWWGWRSRLWRERGVETGFLSNVSSEEVVGRGRLRAIWERLASPKALAAYDPGLKKKEDLISLVTRDNTQFRHLKRVPRGSFIKKCGILVLQSTDFDCRVSTHHAETFFGSIFFIYNHSFHVPNLPSVCSLFTQTKNKFSKKVDFLLSFHKF